MSLFLFLSFLWCSAETLPPTTLYYSGKAEILDLETLTTIDEGILLEKITDSQAALITENICELPTGKPAKKSALFVKVSGSRVGLASDKSDFKGMLSGTVELAGKVWSWDQLKFNMVWKILGNSFVIEDVNFIVRNTIVGRRQLYREKTPIQLWNVQATEVDATEFENQKKAGGC